MSKVFNGSMTINFRVDEEYEILESCGMVTIRGRYVGVADRKGAERLLVFRITNTSHNGVESKSNHRYCGAYLRVDLPYKTERPTSIYLQQTHYGQSVATLRKVGSYEDNRWEIQ